MLEPHAQKLLSSLADDYPRPVNPLDFTLLLQLSDQGYVNVTIVDGKVVAVKTSKAEQIIKVV